MSARINPIPEGYHSVTPYLVVSDAAAAIDFYRKAFGAQELHRMLGPNGRIMHAEISVGDSRIMLSEENAERGWLSPASLKGNSSALYVYVEDVDALFDQAVRAGAEVVMPVEDMFWGDRTGELRDPAGHRWSLATHTEELSQEQMTQRAEAFFASMAEY